MPRRNQNKKKIIIGLTGSFGSGKSTVAGIFRAYGARIIDADKLAHKFLCPGTKSYRKIVAVFGRGILKKDRDIDRRKLSAAVFNSRESLKILNLYFLGCLNYDYFIYHSPQAGLKQKRRIQNDKPFS